MIREAKQQQIEAVRDRFSRAISAVLVDFRGLDVASATELRDEFRKQGVEYKVVKNTIIRLALQGTDLADNDDLKKNLVGPTGVAWSFEDPSAAAKVIKRFREGENKAEKLQVKCGVLDNSVMPAESVESVLATLPGKDEIRSMLLAQLLAPAQSLVRQLQASAQNFAYLLDARKRQLEQG
jgi:large subunit ribosomal protein L10